MKISNYIINSNNIAFIDTLKICDKGNYVIPIYFIGREKPLIILCSNEKKYKEYIDKLDEFID